MDYQTTPRSWKTMVGIKSYTQNKEEVKISKVRFFMRHPVGWIVRAVYTIFNFFFYISKIIKLDVLILYILPFFDIGNFLIIFLGRLDIRFASQYSCQHGHKLKNVDIS